MGESELAMLQQLIDMLGSAGEGTFWLIVLWIGQGYFVGLMWVTGIALVFWVIAVTVKRVVEATSEGNEQRRALQHFADDARRAAHCREPYGAVTPREHQEVLDLIHRGRQSQ